MAFANPPKQRARVRWLGSRWYWAVVAVLAALSAVAVMYGRENLPYTGAAGSLTGRQVGRIVGYEVSTGARVVIPAGRPVIVFYFGDRSPQDLQVARYAGYLAKTRPQVRVGFAVFTAGSYPEMEEMRRSGALPFPVVNDKSRAVGRLLHVPLGADRALVLGAAGRVLFGPPSGAFSPEETRELWERYGVGHISYAPGRISAAMLIGREFPDISVRAVNAHGEARPVPLFKAAPPRGVSYLVFSASCAACTLEGALRTMLPRLRDGHMAALVTSQVPVPEMVKLYREFGGGLPIFQATSEIPGLESVYYDQGPAEGSVLLVRADSRGLVESVRALP